MKSVHIRRIAQLTAFALPLALVTGCEWPGNRDRDSAAADPMLTEGYGFDLVPSTREIAQGEIVTVATRSRNLIGRDARVEWVATGGNLVTEQSDTVARIQFDQPGTYTVRARLFVDGRPVEQDSIDVRVRPLR